MTTCSISGLTFSVSAKELDFLERVAPIIGGTKFPLPSPAHSPQVRMRSLMAWRNERSLYARTCDRTGAPIISMYHPHVRFPVYHARDWWSENFDAVEYGRDFDFNRTAFEQFSELQNVVPRVHLFTYSIERLVNSDYTNCSGDLKDCYMTFCAGRNELCLYSGEINDSYSCVDCLFALKCNNCFECVDIDNCHSLQYSQSCKNCYDSYFLYDCRGCSDCIACVGLRQKRWHILNKEYSPIEYQKIKNQYFSGSYTSLATFRPAYEKLLLEAPRKAIHGDQNENCTGDYISRSKHCDACFFAANAEDCSNCVWFTDGKDCMDFYSWGEAELCYNVVACGDNAYRVLFSSMASGTRDSIYVDLCNNSKNCLLSVGLKRKEYCILNKQYSKSEYEILAARIIEHMMSTGEWGSFFPPTLSTFGYNETAAFERYPLEREDALALGYPWSDYKSPPPTVKTYVDADKLADNIADIGDDILEVAVRCIKTQKPFRITRNELDFYRRNSIPLPRIESNARHQQRVAQRNSLQLHERECSQCREPIVTTYSPDRPEVVVCESCYLADRY